MRGRNNFSRRRPLQKNAFNSAESDWLNLDEDGGEEEGDFHGWTEIVARVKAHVALLKKITVHRGDKSCQSREMPNSHFPTFTTGKLLKGMNELE